MFFGKGRAGVVMTNHMTPPSEYAADHEHQQALSCFFRSLLASNLDNSQHSIGMATILHMVTYVHCIEKENDVPLFRKLAEEIVQGSKCGGANARLQK